MTRIKSLTGRARFALSVAAVLSTLAPGASPQNKLSTTQFLVVGEGLAAGMADFALRDVYQKTSFPALMAAQMNTAFPQPLIQPPGISGGAPGFPELPAGLPVTLQGSVRDDFPPNLFVFNVAMPGAKVTDALNYRPSFPLIQPNNVKQTTANLILGYPTLIFGQDLPLWSQVDYAVAMNPTLVVVELGYFDVLDAAANNDPSRLPNAATFASDYSTILSRLTATGATVVVMTIPDPFDTAFFTSLTSAPNYLGGAPSSALALFLAMNQGDYFTPSGITQAATALLTGNVNPFFSPFSAQPGVVVNAATQTAVESSLKALNDAINKAAKQAGSNVLTFDLQALLHQVRQNGLTAGSNTLTADYLGGFYTLDGYYPGQTGQALIANQVLTLLNTTFKTNFPLLNLTTVSSTDPAMRLTVNAARKPPTNGRGIQIRIPEVKGTAK